MDNKVYILLPVHNRKDITKKFISSLLKQNYQNYHLILIDDGSTDGTADIVSQNIPPEKLTILSGKGNWWWGGSLHQGYKWIKKNKINPEDLVLMMNDDTIFEPDFLTKGIELITKSTKTLLLAYSYSQQTKKILDRGVHVDWKSHTFRQATNDNEINCLQTMGLIFYVKDFYKIGGFHPILIPHYVSDYDFTIKANQKGYKLTTNEEFKLFTDEKTTNNDTSKIVKHKTIFDYFKSTYSVRSPVNPVSWFFFTLFRAPGIWKITGILKVLKIILLDIKHYLIGDIKYLFSKKK